MRNSEGLQQKVSISEREKVGATEGETLRGWEMRKRAKKKVDRVSDSRLIAHFRELDVYKRAFAVAMQIYEITRNFPTEERYSLVDQIRRSSRSVCSNIAEAWRKRRYVAVFKNKLTDAMQEASETQCWCEFAVACSYIDKALFESVDAEYDEIILMLNSMEKKASKFCY